MSEQQAEQQAQVISIPIDRLADSPYQPRTSYDPDNLRELTDSIRQNGVLQPCPVRQVGPNNWELIGGHTRKRAALAAGLSWELKMGHRWDCAVSLNPAPILDMSA